MYTHTRPRFTELSIAVSYFPREPVKISSLCPIHKTFFPTTLFRGQNKVRTNTFAIRCYARQNAYAPLYFRCNGKFIVNAACEALAYYIEQPPHFRPLMFISLNHQSWKERTVSKSTESLLFRFIHAFPTFIFLPAPQFSLRRRMAPVQRVP